MVECYYCKTELDPDFDDYEGIQDGQMEEVYCKRCGKTFLATAHVEITFTTQDLEE
jgi:hypothetical protein